MNDLEQHTQAGLGSSGFYIGKWYQPSIDGPGSHSPKTWLPHVVSKIPLLTSL